MMVSKKKEHLSQYEQGVANARAYMAGDIAFEEATTTIRDQLSEEPCLRLFDHWKQQINSGALPLIGDIDMMALPDLVPFLYQAAFVAEANDWRLDYVGRNIVSNYEHEPTGKLLSELVSGYDLDLGLEKYKIIQDSKLPIFQFLDLSFVDKSFIDAHDLTLPVRSNTDGNNVTHVIGLFFTPQSV